MIDFSTIKEKWIYIYSIYKQIFIRIFRLISNSEEEWINYKEENDDTKSIQKKYFFPFLGLFVLATVINSFFTNHPNDSFLAFLIKNTLLNVFLYFILFYLIVILSRLTTDYLFKVVQTYDDIFRLIIFPFCLIVISLIINCLIPDLYLLFNILSIIISFPLYWKGTEILFPSITSEKRTKFSGCMYIVFLFSTVAAKFIIGKI